MQLQLLSCKQNAQLGILCFVNINKARVLHCLHSCCIGTSSKQYFLSFVDNILFVDIKLVNYPVCHELLCLRNDNMNGFHNR